MVRNAQHNQDGWTLLPRHVTDSASHKPDTYFLGVLELVNLVPPEFDLEHDLEFPEEGTLQARMMAALAKLPPALRAHLLEVWHETGEFSALTRYRQIRTWRRNLREIINQKLPVNILIEARLELDEKSRARLGYYDQFAVSIQGLDLTYLRECPICRHIFFAKKSNQPTCGDPKHAATYRKRQERENRKTRQELAKRKKKRAKTAPKR